MEGHDEEYLLSREEIDELNGMLARRFSTEPPPGPFALDDGPSTDSDGQGPDRHGAYP